MVSDKKLIYSGPDNLNVGAKPRSLMYCTLTMGLLSFPHLGASTFTVVLTRERD